MSSPAFGPRRADVTNARCRFDVHADDAAFVKMLEEDVRRGLGARPRSIPPKYFYDEIGSRLFDRITELPEYYVTRAEESVLARVAPEIARRAAPDEIVELGPGSCRKVRRLFDALRSSAALRYVPIDFGRDGLRDAVSGLTRDYDRLHVHVVIGDFERDLVRLPPPVGRRLALFLGSTIGNFEPVARAALLAELGRRLGADGRVLLGVDLVKDRRVLEAAYDDAAGVTAAFNRNVLAVVNRALGADFRLDAYRHHAFYDDAAHRIEMHLIADAAQRVHLPRLGMVLDFAQGEGIWTESSYKFTRASTETMLAHAGLALEAWYTDEQNRFGLALARPAASP
jgi:L-histidine N-alpha-methyltransferase